MKERKQQAPDHEKNDQNNPAQASIILKKILLICLGILLWLSIFACSQPSEERINESAVDDQAGQAPVLSEEASLAGDSPFDGSKIIYRGNIRLTTDDYLKSFDQIISYTKEVGGFIQESGSNFASQETRANSGYLTIRIPAEHFSQAMEKIQSFANPLSADISSDNISQQYRDVETQINNLRVQEQRLLELLKAATNMTDILAIESELNRLRTEIDQLTSMKKNWDIEINYSTIYISLEEKAISSTSVNSPFAEIFTRIGEGFVTSINLLLRLMAFLLVLLFSLLPFAAIILLFIYLFLKVRKKIKEKKGQPKKNLPGKEDKPPTKEDV